MEKLKTSIVTLFSITIFLGAIALLTFPGSIVPPAHAAGAKETVRSRGTSRLTIRRAATRSVLRCLNALCETGASDAAVAEARGLTVRLGTFPPPAAHGPSAVLKSVLSYRAGVSAVLLPGCPGIPRDLIDRAAAACSARGHRRAGEIVLSFAGDCTFGKVNGDDSGIRFPSVYQRSGRPDYPFALVRPWFLNDDLSVVNFECTLTDAVRTADKQWHFQGPARYAGIFPAGSVEVAGLSNNHSFDYLRAGFDDTVANFRKAHVPVFYQNTPFITTLHGVQTVLIGDCTVVGENTTKIDGAPARVLREIRRYKKPDNIVIVVMHWGSELATIPFAWQQALGREFIDAGADAVVGHHPHVLQGIERYKGRYIAYSLGNFAFGGNSLAPHPETLILRLRFHTAGGQTRTMDAGIVPCRITSSQARNAAGVLRNNYQPKPVFGAASDRIAALILHRSASLKYGVKQIAYLKLR
jgi:poly-gamma-glutamate capsule biosynthesis protein CapA/YwtB (metallophosphatase superfamily)